MQSIASQQRIHGIPKPDPEVDISASMNFSFKCHRENPSTGIANVYSVNDISFHPTFGTFSTAGSDGTFHFWYVFLVAFF